MPKPRNRDKNNVEKPASLMRAFAIHRGVFMQASSCGAARAITVNGQTMESAATTLEALLEEHSLKGVPLVAEINGAIVKQEDFAATPIQGGDRIELVRFVGGG